MSVVSLLPNYWDNNDGLRVKFPGSAATLAKGGAYPLTDGRQMLEAFILLASLPTAASGNEQIILENAIVPAGSFIEKVEVLVTKEPTGTNANLDLGFCKTVRSTEYDFNGLLADADAFENATTDLGVFTEYVKGTTEAGALIGAVTTFDGILTASPSTADWTTGVLRVRVYYSANRSVDV